MTKQKTAQENLEEMFINSASEAYEAASQVTMDPYKRAMAFAAIMQGLSGKVSVAASSVVKEVAEAAAAETVQEEPVEEKQPEPKKEKKNSNDKFKKRPSKKAAVKEEPKPEAEEEVKEEEVPAEEPQEEQQTAVEEASAEAKDSKDDEEENFTEEWTPQALEHFAKEIGEVEHLKDALGEYAQAIGSDLTGEEMMDTMVRYALDREGDESITAKNDITPLNIRYIIDVTKQSMAEAEKANDGDAEDDEQMAQNA